MRRSQVITSGLRRSRTDNQILRVIVVAVVIAWPVGYFLMHSWLQNFAYRIGLGVETFILAAALALMIAVLTVAYQTLKASLANPVDSLHYE